VQQFQAAIIKRAHFLMKYPLPGCVEYRDGQQKTSAFLEQDGSIACPVTIEDFKVAHTQFPSQQRAEQRLFPSAIPSLMKKRSMNPSREEFCKRHHSL